MNKNDLGVRLVILIAIGGFFSFISFIDNTPEESFYIIDITIHDNITEEEGKNRFGEDAKLLYRTNESTVWQIKKTYCVTYYRILANLTASIISVILLILVYYCFIKESGGK